MRSSFSPVGTARASLDDTIKASVGRYRSRAVGVRIGWITALIGAVIAIVGTFVPWAMDSVGGSYAAYYQTSGLAVIISGVLGLAFVFFGRAGARLAIIFGLLVVAVVALTRYTRVFVPPLTAGRVNVGYGIWVSLAGGIVMVLGGWSARTEADRDAKAKAASPS